MPPLTANGPSIPADLLQKHEEGRLVLFCGAGVSLEARLPTFQGLVDRTYALLGEETRDGEQVAYRAGSFDRVFELLERRIDRHQVRQKVQEVLTPTATASLDAHVNLLRLARDNKGKYRIITTNFDSLFERAAEKLRIGLKQHIAPTVPPQSLTWSGIIHLHGAIPDLDSLILSSSDFGRAYLTEGWASRFLKDLFREYAVLFVGYGLKDPIIRYLTDALASQRSRGESFKDSWVLAGVRGGTKGEVDRRGWSDTGVKVIFFDKTHHHKRLYKTLDVWAHLHSGGLQQRGTLAASKILSPPDSSQEDDAQLVAWALSDPTGTAARLWTEAWRRRAAARGLLNRLDGDRALKWLAILEERHEVSSLILGLGRQGLPSQSSAMPGSRATHYLAQWLSLLIHSEGLLNWIIDQGCRVHPTLIAALRDKLKKHTADLSSSVALFFSVVCTDGYQASLAAEDDRTYIDDEHSPSPWTRLDMWRKLQIIPRFRRPHPLSRRRAPEGDQPDPYDIDLAVAGDRLSADRLLRHFQERASQDTLSSYASLFTNLLSEAVMWHQHLLSPLDPYRDSWFDLRSLSDPNRNLRRHGTPGWPTVALLAAHSLGALSKRDRHHADLLLGQWQRSHHPIFERLVLHVVTQYPNLNADIGVEHLLRENGKLLWELYVRPERDRFLRLAGPRINLTMARDLEAAILAGPPEADQ